MIANRRIFLVIFNCILAGSCKTTGKSSLANAADQSWFQVFEPANESERQVATDQFIQVNGSEWERTTLRLDEFSVVPVSGFRKLSSESNVEANLPEIAREFLARNQAIFKLTSADLSSVEVITNQEDPNRLRLKSRSLTAYPNFENVPTFGYQINFEIIFSGGAIRSFINRTFVLPQPLRLSSTPAIKESDPIIREAVLGQKFKYSNFAGQEIETPEVTDGNIESAQLVVVSRRTDDGKLWLGLVYALRIKLGELYWTAYVSSDSGRMEWVNQDFFT